MAEACFAPGNSLDLIVDSPVPLRREAAAWRGLGWNVSLESVGK